MSIIKDITTAVKLTGTIRSARESGCTVRLMIDAPTPTVQDKEKPAEAATPTDFKAEQKNEHPVSASIITKPRKERK